MLHLIAALVISFTCQPARRDGWLCCSTPRAQAQESFACPSSAQIPYIISATGQYLFCTNVGGTSECPQNGVCQQAVGRSERICCIFRQTSTNLVCPNNAIPQPAVIGYLECSSNTNICDFGYSCVSSANIPSRRLCCTSNNPIQPICPNNGVPQSAGSGVQECNSNPNICNFGFSCVTAINALTNVCCSSGTSAQPICPNTQRIFLDNNGLPRNCLISQPSACPSGYSCQQSPTPPNPFVCCTTASAKICPSSFTAVKNPQGENINCAAGNNVGCPAGASCLMDANPNPQGYLCCRPSTAQMICPNGLRALLTPSNEYTPCSGPGVACPRVGYSCHYSTSLSAYACCGLEVSAATCADGRETFTQVSGQTYTCDPLSTNTGCPFGYDCAFSTQPGISVCCRQNIIPTTTPTPFLQCPNGWNAFRNAFTQQVQYCSSTLDQSCPNGYSCTPSSQPSTYLCCRLASSLTCNLGNTLLANGQPRLCSRNMPNQCPRGYSCQQSSNPSVTICCSSFADEAVLCPDRSRPSMIGPNPRHCPLLNSNAGCPAGYVCQLSNKEVNVCCINTFSSSNTRLAPSSLAKCPSGVTPSKIHQDCRSNNDCPRDSSCVKLSGNSVCCSIPVPIDTRCKARRTLLHSGDPIECILGSTCDSGYECSQDTTNGRAVCCETTEKAQETCPESRVPFIVARTESVMYCDATAYVCPQGHECILNRDGSRHVCCSPAPQCPTGSLPPSRTIHPPRCFSSDGCSDRLSCLSSTLEDVKVCCTLAYNDQPPKDLNEDDEWVIVEG